MRKDEIENLADARKRKFLEDFAIFFPRIKQFSADQLNEYWFSMVMQLTMDQLKDVLDHFAFNWGDHSKFPLPGDFRRVCQMVKRAHTEEQYGRDDKIVHMPLKQSTVVDFEQVRQSLGMKPWTAEQREQFASGGKKGDDNEH